MIDELLNGVYGWLVLNWQKLAILIITGVALYFIYRLLSKEITKLKEKQKLEENLAFNLNRFFKWIFVLIVVGILIAQFGFDIGLIAGFMALAGGTIIGFASINTVGNAIAGIIVMTSKPFKIGDRLLFNNQFADVVAIDLIYTRMKTLDNVRISVPNQQMLTSEIDNFGKRKPVRRSCSVTVGYELSFEQVEKALLEAATKVEGVLTEPKPYVWVTNLLNFSVEYSVYVFVSQIKRIPIIDSNFKRTVLEVCRKHGIELATPNLIQSVHGNPNIVYSE